MEAVLTDQPDKIAIAVSGGGDSMALALLAHEWCLANGIKMMALTVDHGLRAESAIEAHQVKDWMSNLGIDHQILTWVGHKPDVNIQDEARNARYRLMGEWCHQNDVNHLILAHHKNDQAETFLMRLLRGSGVDGLSAMEEKAHFPVDGVARDLYACRPLLEIPKKRLLGYLESNKQEWIEDPSNQRNQFLRIQVRNLINDTEIDGLDIDRLSTTAKRMRRVRSLLDELTDAAESSGVTYNPLGFAKLNLETLSALHEEIALRLISRILKKVSGGHYPPRHNKLERLYENMQKSGFPGHTLMGTIVFKVGENDVVFVREPNGIDADYPFKNKKKILWDKRFIINVDQIEGSIKPYAAVSLKALQEKIPDLKERQNNYFNDATLRDRIMPSLPCIITNGGDILLPEILLQFLELRDLSGFSIVFKE